MSGSADTLTRLVPDARTDVRDGYAEVGDVRLHYVEAGDGPLVVLLHGFPEFWYGWRLQLATIVAAGFRIVAPDLRGYDLSYKPAGVGGYGCQSARRRRARADRAAGRTPRVVGHDWGAGPPPGRSR